MIVQKITVGGVDYTDKPDRRRAAQRARRSDHHVTDKMDACGVARRVASVGSAAVIMFPVERDQWTRTDSRRDVAGNGGGEDRLLIGGLPATTIVAVDPTLTAWQIRS
jgi:hypothetical protein